MQEEQALLLAEDLLLPNNNALVVPAYKKILRLTGKGLVVIDTLPKAMLTFTLLERVLESLSWGRFIPAPAGAVGTYVAVYSLLSPYVATQLADLPVHVAHIANKIKSGDFGLSDLAQFPLHLINIILTCNAAYVFCGMQLEGISSMAIMFNEYSTNSSGTSKNILAFLSNLFSNPYFKWPLSIIDIPVTLLVYSAVHKHFIMDTPKEMWVNLKKYFYEPAAIGNKRQSLIFSLDEYIKDLRNLNINTIEQIYKELCISSGEKSIVEKMDALSHHLPLLESQGGNRCWVPPFELSKRLLALSAFFMGTYCMVGNVETSSDSFGLNGISDGLLYLMSLATRISITAIWFENAYDAMENIFKSVIKRDLGIRLDTNWKRIMIFSLALLAGGASSISVVQSTLIALALNNIDVVSLLGIVYIVTAAFGTTIADGTPVFNSRMESFNNSYKKKGDSSYKLYRINQELNHAKLEISKAKTETISAIAATKSGFFAKKNTNIQKENIAEDIKEEDQEQPEDWGCVII